MASEGRETLDVVRDPLRDDARDAEDGHRLTLPVRSVTRQAPNDASNSVGRGSSDAHPPCSPSCSLGSGQPITASYASDELMAPGAFRSGPTSWIVTVQAETCPGLSR